MLFDCVAAVKNKFPEKKFAVIKDTPEEIEMECDEFYLLVTDFLGILRDKLRDQEFVSSSYPKHVNLFTVLTQYEDSIPY